jgi:hypothetical protein
MKVPPVNSLFNSPFELGIRMVYLLSALRPYGADLQKLVLLDYATVYSKDLGGPASLHTPVPYRGGELLSRRELIEQGIYLMSTRGLIDVQMGADGVTYVAGAAALTMVGSLTSNYFIELEARCKWVAGQFASSNSSELTSAFAEQGHLWGAELEASLAHGENQWPLY